MPADRSRRGKNYSLRVDTILRRCSEVPFLNPRPVWSRHNLRVHPGWTGSGMRCRHKQTGSEVAEPCIHHRKPIPEANAPSPATPCYKFSGNCTPSSCDACSPLQEIAKPTAGPSTKSIFSEPLIVRTSKVFDFRLQFKLKRLRQTSHQVSALLVPEQNPPSGAEMLTTN